MEKADGPWTLPEDLATLHNVIIHYGVHVQKASAAQHEKTGNGPLSHMALSHLHRIAIVNHRATRSFVRSGLDTNDTNDDPHLVGHTREYLCSCFKA